MSTRAVCIALLATAAAGCAAHVRGVVESAGQATTVRPMGGRNVPLWLVGEGRPLAELDGYTVEVWGRRALGPLRVERWAVVEGSLPAFVGIVERRGVQLGLLDQGSHAFYFLDGVDALDAHVGDLVVVEGYVDGPHRVRVTAYRALVR